MGLAKTLPPSVAGLLRRTGALPDWGTAQLRIAECRLLITEAAMAITDYAGPRIHLTEGGGSAFIGA
jgi:hypothetical protein